jgi:hypothetical protein
VSILKKIRQKAQTAKGKGKKGISRVTGNGRRRPRGGAGRAISLRSWIRSSGPSRSRRTRY